jgi:polyhydroxyalkanoate synthesis repressor PhaR
MQYRTLSIGRIRRQVNDNRILKAMNERKAMIKKYGDRRLYDSSARRYVKLDDIAGMIREGIEVDVIDARTGKDLTRVVLTQIIMEDMRDGTAGLPVKLLRQLVVASDRATHDFLSWYLETAFELYRKAGAAFRMRLSEAKSVVSNPLESLRHMLGSVPGLTGNDSAELEDLRRRVLELETRLAQYERRTTSRTRKKGGVSPLPARER